MKENIEDFDVSQVLAPVSNKLPKVIQSNQFLNARFEMTANEHRMVKMVFAQIEQSDVHFKPYKIKLREFNKLVNSKHNGSFKELRQIAEGLLEKQYEMLPDDEKRREKGGFIKGNFFSRIEYVPEDESFEMVLDTKLEEHLLNLKGHFTWYFLQYGMRPKSVYSQRLYEILKQHEYKKKVRLELNEIRKTLRVEDKYSNYADFKRYVLLQGKKEMDKYCDVTFTVPFEEIKEGRRVVAVILDIVENHEVISKASALLNSSESTGLENELKQFGLSTKQAKEIISRKDAKEIRDKMTYVSSKHAQGKINSNLAAYLLATLNSDSTVGQSAMDKRQEERISAFKAEQEYKESSLQKEQRTIEQLRNQFDSLYDREFLPYRTKLEKDASSDEWKEFEAYAQTYALFCKDIIVNGVVNAESEHYEMILRGFIASKIGSFEDMFKKWAVDAHGYYLIDDAKTQTAFRIETKQEILL